MVFMVKNYRNIHNSIQQILLKLENIGYIPKDIILNLVRLLEFG